MLKMQLKMDTHMLEAHQVNQNVYICVAPVITHIIDTTTIQIPATANEDYEDSIMWFPLYFNIYYWLFVWCFSPSSGFKMDE